MKANSDRASRLSFDAVAGLYDEARPGYPARLIEDIIGISGIPRGGRILEIGCGTGQATAAFVEKGYHVHCVEPGVNLVDIARRKFSGNPGVTFEVNFFEDSQPPEGFYDMVMSATAFHWVSPGRGYPLMAKALKAGGAIALFWNMHPELSPPVHEALQDVYRDCAPSICATLYAPGKKTPMEEARGGEGDINQSGLFSPPEIRHYNWSREYDAEAYVKLLGTYANYQSLDEGVRENLFAGVRKVIDTEFGGRVSNHYLAVLYVAKKAG